jgi:hypothetical protein
VGIRDRLRRLQRQAEEGGVLIRQRDGTVRAFDVMDHDRPDHRRRVSGRVGQRVQAARGWHGPGGVL